MQPVTEEDTLVGMGVVADDDGPSGRRKKILAVVVLVVVAGVGGLVGAALGGGDSDGAKVGAAKVNIVNETWVMERMGELLIFETQWKDDAYLEGHLPGAIHSGTDQYETGYPNYFLLPIEAVAESAGKMGVSHGKDILIYSDDMIFTARLWFILSYLGLSDSLYILNGSVATWEALGYPTERNITQPTPNKEFAVETPNKDILVVLPEVLNIYKKPSKAVLTDVRSYQEFIGNTSGYPNLTATGRIPNSLWAGEAIQETYTTSGHLLPASSITSAWSAHNIPTTTPLYFYCGNGYRASLAFMYACLLSRPAAMYSSGWYEWSTEWVRNESYEEPPTPGWEQLPSGRPIEA